MMEQKQVLAEQALESISKVLELYTKQANGETIDSDKLEQYKSWFDKMINYQI